MEYEGSRKPFWFAIGPTQHVIFTENEGSREKFGFMNHANILSQSSRTISGEIPERILTSFKPVDTSLLVYKDKLLHSEILIYEIEFGLSLPL
jgi:hypothetical protein